MKRLLLSTVAVLGLTAGTAFALDVNERILRSLTEEGFSRVEVSRTLLGRVRVVAYSDEFRREIVFNPNTGVILRDLWDELEDDEKPAGTRGGGTSGGASAAGSYDDDDYEDDDDYDDGYGRGGDDDRDDDDDGGDDGGGDSDGEGGDDGEGDD